MYNIPSDLLDGFRAAPDTFRWLVASTSPDVAKTARGRDENWSVVEVMCHLRDAEERGLERMRAMRDEEAPFLPAFDQEAWATERDYTGQDLQQALSEFLNLRAQHVAELEALTLEQWERSGIHEEQGRITIMAHTLHLVAHDSMHAAQIARQIGEATGTA